MDKYCCNLCNSPLQGIVYRTHCLHLYCPACAQSSFRTRKCALCHSNLSADSVYEASIGVDGVDIKEQMFQFLMNYGIGEAYIAMEHFYFALKDITNFTNVQTRMMLDQYQALEASYQDKLLEKDDVLVSGVVHR